jgi:uncharacterized OB-fold protein
LPKIAGYGCKECGSIALSYRAVCLHCSSKKLEKVEVDGIGKIFAYTIIRTGPERFRDQEPYAIVLVKLDAGTLVTGRLVTDDLESIENGMKVVLEKQDDVAYWFKPA